MGDGFDIPQTRPNRPRQSPKRRDCGHGAKTPWLHHGLVPFQIIIQSLVNSVEIIFRRFYRQRRQRVRIAPDKTRQKRTALDQPSKKLLMRVNQWRDALRWPRCLAKDKAACAFARGACGGNFSKRPVMFTLSRFTGKMHFHPQARLIVGQMQCATMMGANGGDQRQTQTAARLLNGWHPIAQIRSSASPRRCGAMPLPPSANDKITLSPACWAASSTALPATTPCAKTFSNRLTKACPNRPASPDKFILSAQDNSSIMSFSSKSGANKSSNSSINSVILTGHASMSLQAAIEPRQGEQRVKAFQQTIDIINGSSNIIRSLFASAPQARASGSAGRANHAPNYRSPAVSPA